MEAVMILFTFGFTLMFMGIFYVVMGSVIISPLMLFLYIQYRIGKFIIRKYKQRTGVVE